MNEGLNLNLGCGRVVKAGWMNVDRSRPNPKLLANTRGPLWSLIYRLEGMIRQLRTPAPMRIVTFDLGRPFPLTSASAKVIVAAHVVEHLRFSGHIEDETNSPAHVFLRECRRVLMPGGVLRLSTPDFDLLVDRLSKKDFRFFEAFLPGLGIPALPTAEESFLRILYERGSHCYCYNYDILSRLLAHVGFKNIERASYGSSRCPDVTADKMDSLPKEALFVEANP